jgi:hypothetical protein
MAKKSKTVPASIQLSNSIRSESITGDVEELVLRLPISALVGDNNQARLKALLTFIETMDEGELRFTATARLPRPPKTPPAAPPKKPR